MEERKVRQRTTSELPLPSSEQECFQTYYALHENPLLKTLCFRGDDGAYDNYVRALMQTMERKIFHLVADSDRMRRWMSLENPDRVQVTILLRLWLERSKYQIGWDYNLNTRSKEEHPKMAFCDFFHLEQATLSEEDLDLPESGPSGGVVCGYMYKSICVSYPRVDFPLANELFLAYLPIALFKQLYEQANGLPFKKSVPRENTLYYRDGESCADTHYSDQCYEEVAYKFDKQIEEKRIVASAPTTTQVGSQAWLSDMCKYLPTKRFKKWAVCVRTPDNAIFAVYKDSEQVEKKWKLGSVAEVTGKVIPVPYIPDVVDFVV